MENNANSRRNFIRNAALSGIACSVGISALSSCSNQTKRNYNYPPMLDSAPDGKVLKAGVVGCGYRGTGAALNFSNAGPNLEIVSLGDVFADRLDLCRQKLKEKKGIEIDSEKCFVGFDAYHDVINSGVDIIILATPPHFRPQHFDACVRAHKHVFMEKPIAVDPVGVRSIMISGQRASQLGLSVVTGTIKRHQEDYLATFKQIADGALGKIVSANSYYNVGKLWHKSPRDSWSEMECMIRDWVNWCWLSGDHIVEQHVHNLDVVNWFVGKHPIEAIGFGARQRRLTGDQYDMFSVDFMYEDNVHYHSMCRQINGCENNVGDIIRGENAYTNCRNTIYNNDTSVNWEYKYDNPEKSLAISSYDREHIDLVTAIRTNKPINETQWIAESTMTGIMGRISAYTGKKVSWDEMMNSDLYLGPKKYDFANVDILKKTPIPGE